MQLTFMYIEVNDDNAYTCMCVFDRIFIKITYKKDRRQNA